MSRFLGALAVLACLGPAPAARADDVRPAGALTGHFLIADRDLGGGALLDVWAVADWARVGGFVGAAATPSDRDASNRVFMPVGLSLAAELEPDRLLTIQLRVRGGLWAGATQAEKLTLGAFAGGGAYLGFQLGGGAVAYVGADVWAVIASDAWRDAIGPDDRISESTWVIAPGVGLSWTPGPQAPEPESAGE